MKSMAIAVLLFTINIFPSGGSQPVDTDQPPDGGSAKAEHMVRQVLDPAIAVKKSSQAHQEFLRLFHSYMRFDEDSLREANEQVYSVLGSPFLLDEEGPVYNVAYSIKDGEGTYSVVEDVLESTAFIQDLNLRNVPLDSMEDDGSGRPGTGGALLEYLRDQGLIAFHIYRASFQGSILSVSHFGMAAEFEIRKDRILVFIPLAVAAPEDLEVVGDAFADMLGADSDEEGFAGGGGSSPSPRSGSGGGAGTRGGGFCDEDALAECLEGISEALQAALDKAEEDFHDCLDQVQEDFNDKIIEAGLQAGVGTTVTIATLGGSKFLGKLKKLGGPFSGAGAWLGMDGWDELERLAKEKIEAIEDCEDERAADICDATADALEAILDCVRDFCPGIYDEIFAAALRILTAMGCL